MPEQLHLMSRGPWATKPYWVLLLLATLALVQPPRAYASPVYQWTSPEMALRGYLEGSEPLSLAPAGAAVSLRRGETLLVAARPGDQLKVEGEHIRVGYASGKDDYRPDSVIWTETTSSELRVPTWQSLRYLAVRAVRATQVRVWVAERGSRPLTQHRLTRQVYEWLQGTAPRPSTMEPDTARALSLVVALRELTLRAGLCPTAHRCPQYVRDWLQTQWLRQRLRTQRLPRPYFEERPMLLSEARLVEDATLNEEWYEIEEGATLTIAPQSADVVSLLLSAHAVGTTRYELWQGGLLVERNSVKIAPRARDAARWTEPRSLRVVPRGDLPILLRVHQGRARVQVVGRRARSRLFETAAAHRLPHSPPPSSLPPALLTAWRFDLGINNRSVAELEASLVAADGSASDSKHAALLALTVYMGLPFLTESHHLEDLVQRLWQSASTLGEREATALLFASLEAAQRRVERPREAYSPLIKDLLSLPQSELAAEPNSAGGPRAIRRVDARSESSDASVDLLEPALLRATLRKLFTLPESRPPDAMARLEASLGLRAYDHTAVDLARELWSRSAPWHTLDAVAAATTIMLRQPEPEGPPPTPCKVLSGDEARYLLVPTTPLHIEVADLGGTHAVMRIIPTSEAHMAGSEIRVDDQIVPVHPLLQEPSKVALSPGVHVLEHVSGSQVLARVAWDGELPCDQLRERERWVQVDGPVEFQLPRSSYPLVASVVVSETSLGGRPVRLSLSAVGLRATAWVSPPATGTLSFEVPPGSPRLEVRSDRPVLLKARVRLHPKPPRNDAMSRRSPPSGSSASPSRRSGWTQEDLAAIDSLGRLRQLTKSLRAASRETQRQGLRRRRARLLEALGFDELASIDLLRSGRVDLASERHHRDARFFPSSLGQVVPLWFAAQAPLARGRQQDGLSELSLANAWRALEEGRTREASLVFLRLARHYDSGSLWRAAAMAVEGDALSDDDVEKFRLAFALAKQAALHDAAAGVMLNRYDEGVRWRPPSLATLGQRTVRVESGYDHGAEQSVTEQAKRAILLAPESARLFHKTTRYSLRRITPGTTLQLSALCHQREGPTESCGVEVLLDHSRLACGKEPSKDVALPIACSIVVPEQAHWLELRLPPHGHPMGWAVLEHTDDVAGVGEQRSVAQRTRYAHVLRKQSAQLQVKGPTVVRVRARALDGRPTRISLRAEERQEASTRELAPVTFPLSAELDASAVAREGQTGISIEQRFEYVITEPGRFHVHIEALDANALIRPEVAVLERPPPPPPHHATRLAVPPPEELRPLTHHGYFHRITPVEDFAAPSALSMSAQLLLQDRDLSDTDGDSRDRFMQLGGVGRRELWDNRLWLETTAFARLREGAASFGMSARADLPSRDGWPGASLRLQLVNQPSAGATGSRARLAVSHRMPFGPWLAARGELAWTGRSVATELRGKPDADGDVYSSYGEVRPHTWDAAFSILQRPHIDTRLAYSVAARLNPGFESLDRVDGEVSGHALSGSSHSPWLRVAGGVSHRPASLLRSRGFTRFRASSSAFLWHWRTPTQRVSAELSLSAFWDSPTEAKGLFASLETAFDLLEGVGLRDFRPAQRLFRERLEEDGPGPLPVPSSDFTPQPHEVDDAQ